MRILFTGMSRNQLYGSKLVQYDSFPLMLQKRLAHLGHEVDVRPVVPGEDLSSYDRVIVGVTNLLSIGARFTYGALWAIHHREDVIPLIDDADVRGQFSSFRGVGERRPEYLWRPALVRDNRDEAVYRASFMEKAARRLAEWSFEAPAVFALLHGEGTDLLREDSYGKLREIAWIDPRRLQPDYTAFGGAWKYRRWIFAALGTGPHRWFEERCSPEWEVVKFGDKKFGGGRQKAGGSKGNIPELVLVSEHYAWSRGIVAHPYRHAGSGWWRARFRHASDVGAVVYVDPREARSLGPEFQFELSDYEKMTDDELDAVASAQAWAMAGTPVAEVDRRLSALVAQKTAASDSSSAA